MATGLKASQANSILDTLLATVYVKLHTGDPGAAGTANASSVTTRTQVTYAVASGGSKALTAAVQLTNWAGTDGETVSHYSLWDAASSGNFLDSGAWSTPRTMHTGDTAQFNSLTFTLPVAA